MGYNDTPLIRVSHPDKHFSEGCPCCRSHLIKLQGNHRPKCGTVYACRDINFDVYGGGILDVVGESGSGKSTMMQCLCLDQEVTRGNCTVRTYRDGAANTFELIAQQQRYTRNHMSGVVYQSPYLGLKMNFPSMGSIAGRLIATEKRNVKAMSERDEELLSATKTPVHRMEEEPRKFSGGVQQRVQIAETLSNNSSILLLNEIAVRLDLSVQANALDLIKKIQRELGISMPMIPHDLGVTRISTGRTIVMLDREIIEQGLTDQVMKDLQHPYTQQLVYSLL